MGVGVFGPAGQSTTVGELTRRCLYLVEEEGAREHEPGEREPDVVVPEVAERHQRLPSSSIEVVG